MHHRCHSLAHRQGSPATPAPMSAQWSTLSRRAALAIAFPTIAHAFLARLTDWRLSRWRTAPMRHVTDYNRPRLSDVTTGSRSRARRAGFRTAARLVGQSRAATGLQPSRSCAGRTPPPTAPRCAAHRARSSPPSPKSAPPVRPHSREADISTLRTGDILTLRRHSPSIVGAARHHWGRAVEAGAIRPASAAKAACVMPCWHSVMLASADNWPRCRAAPAGMSPCQVRAIRCGRPPPRSSRPNRIKNICGRGRMT